MTQEQVNPADVVVKRVIHALGQQTQQEQKEQKEHIEAGHRLSNVFQSKPAANDPESAPVPEATKEIDRAQLLREEMRKALA